MNVDDNLKQKLSQIFTHCPPQTQQRIDRHDAINGASYSFARAVCEQIDNPAEVTTILRKIQEVRMLANAAIYFEEAGISYRGVFEK